MFGSPSLLRGGYLEAGGGSGGHPVDRHVSVAGQRHREGGRRLLKRLLVGPRAGVCRAAALDHPRQRCQPGQADQCPASTAPHWRGGEDPLCHGGQPTGRLRGCVGKNPFCSESVLGSSMKIALTFSDFMSFPSSALSTSLAHAVVHTVLWVFPLTDI